MTGHINTSKNGNKSRPPERARSRAGRRKGGDSEINWMGIGGTRREIHPKGDRNSITIDEVVPGSSITVTKTRLRTTRKPTKTPANKTTSICTRTGHKEDRINTKKRTAGTNQDLVCGREEHIKLILTV